MIHRTPMDKNAVDQGHYRRAQMRKIVYAFSDRLQQEERPMINTGGGFKKIIIPITPV